MLAGHIEDFRLHMVGAFKHGITVYRGDPDGVTIAIVYLPRRLAKLDLIEGVVITSADNGMIFFHLVGTIFTSGRSP